MAFEDDPEHVVALALHPVGAAIERGQRRTAGPAGGQPVEVAAAQLVVGEAGEFRRAIARQGDGEPTVGARVHSEPLLDTRARVGGRHAPPGSDAALRFPVFWNSSTWVWSLSSPYISESGVGGHPGTYTSTGTTRSTPFTTW